MGLLDGGGRDDVSVDRLPHLVLDARMLAVVRSLRQMAWTVLEAVALGATADGCDLVSRTSARDLAAQLALDPGTAAAALRLLRRPGLVELRRPVGPAGRFGLSAYVLGDVVDLGLRPCVGSPGAVVPHAEDPCAEDPHADGTRAGGAQADGLCGGRSSAAAMSARRTSGGPRSPLRLADGQGALDLDLDGDR